MDRENSPEHSSMTISATAPMAPMSLCSLELGFGDCCDGTDEYDGKVTCPNTCWEAGKVARDKLKKKIATYQDGVKLRKEEIEKAKSALDKDKVELLKLKKEESTLKEIVQQLKEHKEEIEKEEEKERLRKEKEEKEKKEAEEKANEEKSAATGEEAGHTNEAGKHSDAKDYAADETKYEQSDVGDSYDGATDSPSSEGSPLNEVEESVKGAEGEHAAKSETDLRVEEKKSSEEIINTGNDASENTEGLSKEELGQLVASRWTGQKGGKQSGEAEDAKKTEEQEDLTSESNNEEYEGYASETDDDRNRYDGEDETEDDFREDERDDVSSSYKPDADFEGEPDLSDSPSWLTKIQRTVRKLFKAVNFFETPLNQTDAARVRKEYDELSSKLSKLQSRVSSLTQKLKHDFGPEGEFYSFYDRCFESKQNKYTYKVCPYDQASQEEGYSTTRLGRWDKFEDSYKVMAFSNGDRCWNGPDRSMKVRMRCGLKNEITDVDEPSRCEYVALLSTPALCKEEKLKKDLEATERSAGALKFCIL
ncbi:hypothetical protein AHAS_Ahas14G0099000 [Arachis hypogaea]